MTDNDKHLRETMHVALMLNYTTVPQIREKKRWKVVYLYRSSAFNGFLEAFLVNFCFEDLKKIFEIFYIVYD